MRRGRIRFQFLVGEPAFKSFEFDGRADGVVGGEVRLEEQAPRRLMSRGEVVGAPGDDDGVARAALAEPVADDAGGGAEEEGAEAGALEVRPVFEAGATGGGEVGEEVAAVVLDGGVRIVGVERGEERVTVGSDRHCSRTPSPVVVNGSRSSLRRMYQNVWRRVCRPFSGSASDQSSSSNCSRDAVCAGVQARKASMASGLPLESTTETSPFSPVRCSSVLPSSVSVRELLVSGAT